MLRISWTERRNSESLLYEIGKQRDLLKTIKKQLNFQGDMLC